MKSQFYLASCVLFMACLPNASTQQPASPPSPVKSISSHPDWPAAKNPSDVDSVDHLVESLYHVISGPAGAPRDWQRFRSLFLPDGRLGVVIAESAATVDAPGSKGDVRFASPAEYVARNSPYFQTHGFFERSIANRVEEFGNLSEVWSTYESRHARSDSHAFARGINSIQIVHAQGRFWIASVLWDDERPGLTMPDKYLK